MGLASSACLAHKAVRKCCEGDCKVIAAISGDVQPLVAQAIIGAVERAPAVARL